VILRLRRRPAFQGLRQNFGRYLADRSGGGGAAYGEVVWFWHPWLMSSQRRRVGPTGLKTNLNPLVTVTKGIRRREEREVSRKAIAQGMPDCLR